MMTMMIPGTIHRIRTFPYLSGNSFALIILVNYLIKEFPKTVCRILKVSYEFDVLGIQSNLITRNDNIYRLSIIMTIKNLDCKCMYFES